MKRNTDGARTHLEYGVNTLAECGKHWRIDRYLLGEFGVELRNIVLAAQNWLDWWLQAPGQHIVPVDELEEWMGTNRLTIICIGAQTKQYLTFH